jgi:hypothetical protein
MRLVFGKEAEKMVAREQELATSLFRPVSQTILAFLAVSPLVSLRSPLNGGVTRSVSPLGLIWL